MQILHGYLLAVWMISYLFDDHMFTMVVQPDRHFRGKTELPENGSIDKCWAFFPPKADTASETTLWPFVI